MATDLMKRLREDKEFAQKLQDEPDYETRLVIVQEEGYPVKHVKDYIERTRNDSDFSQRLNSLDSYEEKAEFILMEGYFFSLQDLLDEQERIVELSDDELVAVAGGKYGADLASSCCQSACPDWFKCTWG